MIGLKIAYVANIIVAGWISYSCIFRPKNALLTIFTGAFEYSEAIRLVGTLWAAICILSVFGLFYPRSMAPVLLFQVIYKGSWLLLVALPALLQNKPYPRAMALFFIIWVVFLPFVIPWNAIFTNL